MEEEIGNFGKRENLGIFILRMGDWILMKLGKWKDLMSQMPHCQFESYPGTQGVEGETEILGNAQSGEIGMKLDGKNKYKLQIRD